MSIALTTQDTEGLIDDNVRRRIRVFDLIDEVAPEVLDNPNLGPKIAEVTPHPTLLALAEAVQADPAAKYSSLRVAVEAICRVLRDLDGTSPFIDEVAVNRALDGDVRAFRNLTPLEFRAMSRAVARVGWTQFRYGLEERRSETIRSLNLGDPKAYRGFNEKEGATRHHLFADWTEGDLQRIYDGQNKFLYRHAKKD